MGSRDEEAESVDRGRKKESCGGIDGREGGWRKPHLVEGER